jgi:hypothetical protein
LEKKRKESHESQEKKNDKRPRKEKKSSKSKKSTRSDVSVTDASTTQQAPPPPPPPTVKRPPSPTPPPPPPLNTIPDLYGSTSSTNTATAFENNNARESKFLRLLGGKKVQFFYVVISRHSEYAGR